jgi:hypothetical protein
MKTLKLFLLLALPLLGCAEDKDPDFKSHATPQQLKAYEAQLADEAKIAAEIEAARWKQIEANFALSLEQQKAAEENPEALEPSPFL